MNTNKQIAVMILLVFGAVFATGAYTLWEPGRQDDAEVKQHEATLERGAWLFSQNCRTCHGDSGEGGAASNRLRVAPPLNRPDLQGRKELGGEVDNAAYTTAYKLIVNTITCGRVGRAMPVWAQSQGGTLSDEQIRQLAVFITDGSAWEIAKEYAIDGVHAFELHGDASDGIRFTEPVNETTTRVRVNKLDLLSPGIRIEANGEIMLVTAVDANAGQATVERGVGTTSPKAHTVDEVVLKPPVPPDPAPILEQSCGQTAPAAAPTSSATETPSATLSIIAKGVAWDKTKLAALAGVPLTLTLDNQDVNIPHNIHFFQGAEPGGESVVATEIQNGPVKETLNFGPLDAGDYYYVCDVHPAMEGVLTASLAGGGGPAASPAAGSATPAPSETPGAAETPAAPASTPAAGG